MESENFDGLLLKEIEAHAVYIAGEAGRILLEHFGRPLEVRFKGKNGQDPATTADSRSEEYLRTSIREKFPGHGILGEEGGTLSGSDSPFIWILDPLDGTANFMNHLPLYAVSVGVLWQGRPVAGAIYVPVSHRAGAGVYHARLGGGAYLDNEKIEVTGTPPGRPLAEIPGRFRSRLRLSNKDRKELPEARNLGSIALELALAACGVFRYAIHGSPRIWDVAAGVVLVNEAGGLAFSRPRKARHWRPLDRFDPPRNDTPEKPASLGGWSEPTIAGVPDITRKLVKDIRLPRRPFRFFLRRRPRRKKPKD